MMAGPTVSLVQAANKVETSDVNAAGIVTHGIRIGSWKSPVDEIREIYWRELAAHGDREKAKDAVKSKKEQLPGILFSGRFSQRKKEYLIQHSGLLCADLDSLGERRSSVREKLIASPFLFALFLSQSGDGLKRFSGSPQTQRNIWQASAPWNATC